MDEITQEICPCEILAEIIPKGELTLPEFREWITDIEKKMMSLDCAVDRHSEDSGFGLNHTFTPGLYSREIYMPKGSLIISRIHMFEHPYVISKGECSVYDGEKVVRLKAPYQGVTKPGTKRLLYIHEDTLWTTFHVTDKDNFEDIDVNGVITCDSFEEFERHTNKEIAL